MISSLPLFGQSRYGALATALRQRVLDGEWEPGEMIPSEASLASSYGVALGTLRQAISLLVEDGIFRRQHGRGTFVSRGIDSPSMMRFFRFQSGDGKATVPESLIFQRRFRPPSSDEALEFDIDPSSQVMQFERLRSIDGQPCLLENIILPLPLFGALADTDTGSWDDLLYPMYQKYSGILVLQVHDTLSFSQLSSRQAKKLQLAAGHPCVLVERRAYDISNRCIERRTTRGDAYSFTYTAHVK
jgi:GntR family transcriptional regulator